MERRLINFLATEAESLVNKWLLNVQSVKLTKNIGNSEVVVIRLGNSALLVLQSSAFDIIILRFLQS